MRIWIRLGSIIGATAVIIGAFGAHALRETLSVESMQVYQTGCHYQIIHALALLAVGIWAGQLTAREGTLTASIGNPLGSPISIRVAGWAFTLGTVLFSG